MKNEGTESMKEGKKEGRKGINKGKENVENGGRE